MTKTAKLFRNGNSQAVRLPREFRFEGDEVRIRKDQSRTQDRRSPAGRLSRASHGLSDAGAA